MGAAVQQGGARAGGAGRGRAAGLLRAALGLGGSPGVFPETTEKVGTGGRWGLSLTWLSSSQLSPGD